MKGIQSQKKIVLLFLLVGTVSYGFSSVLIKLCLFPSTIIASFRLLLAGLILTPFCIPSVVKIFRDRGMRGFLLLIIPGIVLGLHFQIWVIGIKMTFVASGTFIISISPVFFALFERIISKKSLSVHTAISLGIVIIGAYWLFRTGKGQLGQVGDIYCFIAMLLFVIYLILSQKVSRGVPHITYIHIIYLWGGLLTLPFSLISGDMHRINLTDYTSLFALIALVLFPTLIGHTSSNYAVRYFSPLTVSFFVLLEPIFASIAAVFILAEFPDIYKFPAYVLFLSATLYYFLTSRKI